MNLDFNCFFSKKFDWSVSKHEYHVKYHGPWRMSADSPHVTPTNLVNNLYFVMQFSIKIKIIINEENNIINC